jgi:N-glycosylase/DNA lyase
MKYLKTGAEEICFTQKDFSLEQTLQCGQCFRWRRAASGVWEGAAGGLVCRIAQEGHRFRVTGVPLPVWEEFWVPYFDLSRDYGKLKARLAAHPVLARAAEYSPGLRVLRQPPWEALCTFIISQNNNIPRITGIVERLCLSFGSPIAPGWNSFPSPERLAGLCADDLAPLRSGFRAKYILDAARKVSSGEVSLRAAAFLPIEEAREELMRISGVGQKVADCALLYGLGRVECCPTDVWIRRVMQQFFPQGLPEWVLPEAGLAQQYLFHYARTCPGALDRGE